MATLLTPFIVPASSIGEIYLTVKGVIEQKNPTQIPWIDLPIKSVVWFGIKTRIPAKIAAELQMIKFWLNYKINYFLEYFSIKYLVMNEPIHAPSAGRPEYIPCAVSLSMVILKTFIIWEKLIELKYIII